MPKVKTRNEGVISQKWILPESLVHAAACCFGEPVIQRGKEREDKSAEDRIVEVPDDEICIMQMKVN